MRSREAVLCVLAWSVGAVLWGTSSCPVAAAERQASSADEARVAVVCAKSADDRAASLVLLDQVATAIDVLPQFRVEAVGDLTGERHGGLSTAVVRPYLGRMPPGMAEREKVASDPTIAAAQMIGASASCQYAVILHFHLAGPMNGAGWQFVRVRDGATSELSGAALGVAPAPQTREMAVLNVSTVLTLLVPELGEWTGTPISQTEAELSERLAFGWIRAENMPAFIKCGDGAEAWWTAELAEDRDARRAAEAHFRAALDMDPDLSYPLLFLLRVALAQGDEQRSVSLAGQYLKQCPEHHRVREVAPSAAATQP